MRIHMQKAETLNLCILLRPIFSFKRGNLFIFAF